MPQNAAEATYAAKLSKSEALIDWSANATQILRAVHAYNPFPIAYTILNGVPIKIWQASVRDGVEGEAGLWLGYRKKMALLWHAAKERLCLEVLQRQNAKALPAVQFMQDCSASRRTVALHSSDMHIATTGCQPSCLPMLAGRNLSQTLSAALQTTPGQTMPELTPQQRGALQD